MTADVSLSDDLAAAIDAVRIERDALRTALLGAEARLRAAEEQAAQERWDHGQVVRDLLARMAVLRIRATASDAPYRMAHDAWCWRNHQCPTTEETP